MIFGDNDTIAAPATAAGGALCMIRVSGPRALEVCGTLFRGRTPLTSARAATALYGRLVDGDGTVIDEAVVTPFRAPHSYTGEDSVEISVHGSSYIVRAVMQALVRAGARPAEAGEFTRRAFLTGRMDLAQAEAVADMIAASSRASHAVAATQLRGAYSGQLHALREELLHITSLLELELDFSEEDVEFADRTQLETLLRQTCDKTSSLAASFALGNALKEGVAVAIVGRPNVGKSTLLNRLAGEDRAMVSEIAGTTRDTIEAQINIGGVAYRFIDTAGVHRTRDTLELMGISRTRQAIEKARIVLWLTTPDDEAATYNTATFHAEAALKREFAAATGIGLGEGQVLYKIINKIDLLPNGGNNGAGITSETSAAGNAAAGDAGAASPAGRAEAADGAAGEASPNMAAGTPHSGYTDGHTIRISAKTGAGIQALAEALGSTVDATAAYRGEAIVTNQRHYHALCEARTALEAALDGLHNGLTSDLLSEDIRLAVNHLGEITGEITSADILQNIFSKFCIGK